MSVLENQVAVREGAAVALLGRRQDKLRKVAAQLPRDRALTCPAVARTALSVTGAGTGIGRAVAETGFLRS